MPSVLGPMTWLLTAISAIGQLSISMYTPSMPAIAANLKTTPGMVQVTLGTFLLTFAVAQLVHGPLSDRFGRRRVLIGGLILFIAGSALCALAPSVEVLIAGRALQAIGACSGASIGRAVVRDLFQKKEESARVMAVMAMAFTVAPAAGPILGGYLQAAFDWHAVFVALSVLGAVLLTIVLVALPETNRAPDPMATRPGRVVGTYAGLAIHPGFLAHVIPSTALVAGMLTMHATLPFLLIDRLHYSPTDYGWLTLITVGAFFMGSLTIGRFGRRIGTDRSVRIALTVAAVSGLLYVGSALVLPLSAAGVLGPMVVWVYAMGFSMPACMAGAMAPFPRTAGSASALMGFLQMGGGAVASIVVAKLQDGTLLPAALVMAGLATVAVLGYRRYFPRAATAAAATAVAGD